MHVSLRFKLTGGVILACLAVVLTASSQFEQLHERQLRSDLSLRAHLIGRILAANSANSPIEHLLSAAMGQDEVRAACYLHADGEFSQCSASAQGNHRLLLAARHYLPDLQRRLAPIQHRSGDELRLLQPLQGADGRSIGLLALTLRSAGPQPLLGKGEASISMLLLTAAIASLIFHCLSGWQLRPLRELLQSARALARGDFRQRTPRRHDDELGELADALNAGISHLRHGDQFREELRTAVDRRTADLHAAMREAQRADQSKSEFLANMSHELRTPLHAIISYARLGEGKADHAERSRLRKYFSRIEQSGNRLLLLLNDLLDLSKLEAGRMPLNAREQDLQTIGNLAMADFAALARERQVQLVMRPTSIDTRLHCDGERIAQVMRNLLSNALKFTAEHSAVEIAFAEHGDSEGLEGSVLEVTVSDRGCGIPEEELELVFDKFVQSSKTRSGAGGTGLGLAICREIIQAHDGWIEASNRSNGGARFSLRLPRRSTIPEHHRDSDLAQAS